MPEDASEAPPTQEEKVARARAALEELGPKAREMDGGALVDEINRRTGVGFEAAVLGILTSGY